VGLPQIEKEVAVTDKPIIAANQDKTLKGHAADLGELIIEREREESVFGRRSRRTAELEQMIEMKKQLVARMLNGDEEEFLPPQPKKPYLRIVK
jgi:hypothetical protein